MCLIPGRILDRLHKEAYYMRTRLYQLLSLCLALAMASGCGTSAFPNSSVSSAQASVSSGNVSLEQEDIPSSSSGAVLPVGSSSAVTDAARGGSTSPSTQASSTPDRSAASGETVPYADAVSVDAANLAEETAALSTAAEAAIPNQTTAEASGKLVKQNDQAVIDYSNTADGYVMVQFTGQTDKRLKAQVKGPTTTYTYNLTQGKWATFPLSDGNGSYKITVYENVTDNKYSSVVSITQDVTLKDEFAPFLRPNQYVDYSNASNTAAKAAELTQGMTDPLEKVQVIYDYVVKNLIYDREKAAAVKSGYLPVLDTVLAEQKGICFDYAALMAGMLRSQSVPCKLVVGYAGQAYHAWISVWSEATGWVDGVIYFDGASWQRMDPTFASSGKQSADIMAYIGDGTNYTTKYLY